MLISRAGRWILCIFLALTSARAAYFGKVVPVRGSVSDIALDERHGRLYIANLTANRIEVMNLSDLSLGAPLLVSEPPSSVAVSPDNRYLVVGETNNFPNAPAKGQFTIFDLDANTKLEIALGDPVLAVAFGAAPSALAVTSTQALLLDPSTGRTQPVGISANAATACFPVKFATFPGQIVQAAAGVSGDHNVIVVTASIGGNFVPGPTGASGASGAPGGSGASGASGPTGGTGACAGGAGALGTPAFMTLRYNVSTGIATLDQESSSPIMAPRVVSVDQTGSNYLTGWALIRPDPVPVLMAQFPRPTGDLTIGSHAWDWGHNRIFAQVPASGDGAVMHVLDTDNLTVLERLPLAENLAGRSVWTSDQKTLYTVSISGVTVFPMSAYDTAHRIGALQEDVVFQGDACNRAAISRTVNVTDLGGGRVDFTLSLPSGTTGVRLSQVSGTTPAAVTITVDPSVYQSASGTTVIPLTISSAGSINVAATVRLLVETPDVNQHGREINVPGKITAMLTDRIRNRVYLIRQDKNRVLVYDTRSLQQIGSFRTGNTPVGMAITSDQKYLIVGNDNSQIASVFDLDAMQPSDPIVFLGGTYPRSIAVSNAGIWAIARTALPGPPCAPPGCIQRIDMGQRIANPPDALGLFVNNVDPGGMLASSPGGNSILMGLPDGTVALYDAIADRWIASRKDFESLGGALGPLSDNLFVADNHLLDSALVPVADLENSTGGSSGVSFASGSGLRTTSAGSANPGTIERVDLGNLQTFHGTALVEAALRPQFMQSAPIGQIGETILAFSQALSVPADQSAVFVLGVSGFTVVEPAFDAVTKIPAISSVSNAADGGAVAPGAIISIAGDGLAQVPASAGGAPLPSSLGQVCVTANSIALPLFNVSSSQITAQMPFSASGDALVVVRNPGGVSSSYTSHVNSFAPAVFRSGQAGDQTGIATVVRLKNGELATFTNPVHPDEMLSIYLTGMALTAPLPAPGAGAPSDPLAVVTTNPTVSLNGVNLPIVFAGLVPGEVGVYQIDAYVPKNIQSAAEAPLIISQGGASTALSLRVVNP